MKTNQGAIGNVVATAANICAGSCQKLAAQIGQAKHNLLAEVRSSLEVPERLFWLAVNEAEALAWQTAYPHLVFPELAVEKVEAAARWKIRQDFLRRKNSVV